MLFRDSRKTKRTSKKFQPSSNSQTKMTKSRKDHQSPSRFRFEQPISNRNPAAGTRLGTHSSRCRSPRRRLCSHSRQNGSTKRFRGLKTSLGRSGTRCRSSKLRFTRGSEEVSIWRLEFDYSRGILPISYPNSSFLSMFSCTIVSASFFGLLPHLRPFLGPRYSPGSETFFVITTITPGISQSNCPLAFRPAPFLWLEKASQPRHRAASGKVAVRLPS